MELKIETLECSPEILEEDILEAMKAIKGYLDITPADFKEFYLLAYQHAMNRFYERITAEMVMTREVLFVTAERLLSDVANIMAENNISGLPVVNEHREVTGIISEKDFWRQMTRDEGNHKEPSQGRLL